MSAPLAELLTVPLSEVFGPTFQGEGPHAGRRCGFVRLGLCNLSCEWCDTPYTWDHTRYDVKAECPDTPITQVAAAVEQLGVDVVVLSGGEPLMHAAKLPALFAATHGVQWHVETNGTIVPPDWWAANVTHTTVSPKINTGDPAKKRLKARPLAAWAAHAAAGSAIFKFVVVDEEELAVIAELVAEYGIPPSAVWVMPEGTTAETVTDRHAQLADAILAAGFNTTTRLHVLLWGDRRGV